MKLGFDKFARLATLVCNTEICIINFLDDKTQYTSAESAPEPWLRHMSIGKPFTLCAHTILRRSTEIFEIPDTTKDWRFSGRVFTSRAFLIVAICYWGTTRSILCRCTTSHENWVQYWFRLCPRLRPKTTFRTASLCSQRPRQHDNERFRTTPRKGVG
jgi:hypothetical protein